MYANLCSNTPCGEFLQHVGGGWRTTVAGEGGGHALRILAE